MKTNELTGALLDYWVARATEQCAGLIFERRDDHIVGMGEVDGASIPCVIISGGNILKKMRLARQYDCMVYEPSASWAQGGPIIEHEQIQLMPWIPELAHLARWTGMTPTDWQGSGDTALIAAMRAYVASKFGDEVVDDLTEKESA